MTGFEPRTFGIWNKLSVNLATTTVHNTNSFCMRHLGKREFWSTALLKLTQYATHKEDLERAYSQVPLEEAKF